MRIDSFYNGTVWPVPDSSKDPGLEWTLRYGTPTKEDLLMAASVVAAYCALIRQPQKLRNITCQNIKGRSK